LDISNGGHEIFRQFDMGGVREERFEGSEYHQRASNSLDRRE
jgi:hypothetical protein